MKAILIPAILGLLGTGGGVGAAMFLGGGAAGEDSAAAAGGTPGGEASIGPCGPLDGATDPAATAAAPIAEEAEEETGHEYVRLNNQFIIPVVSGELVAAMVVMSLSLEVDAGQQDTALLHEPRLRDSFLQVLFDHANTGGFDGTFTAATNMRNLRQSLRNAAQATLGDIVHDVLIIDIVREDV